LNPDRSLPTGTVTFLFSDIEGSTRLVQSLGDRYPDLLERHQEILRSAFRHHEGTEVGTEGDSFFVVFPTAGGAVAAAVEGQRGLGAAPWPEGAEIRVRMGLHTGQGVLGAGSYVGVDVHRAARIASAGHGGQILISDATRASLGPIPPDGIDLRELGPHRLKDLLEAERIHQIGAAGLRDEFPPLATLSNRPNNLPLATSTFLGRDEEVASLRRAFTEEGARLVTLTGPGGIGKTRLALQVMAELSDGFEDGVFFVDLSPARDADAALDAIIRVIGAVRGEGPALEQLARALEGKRILLLLDNVEQVIDVANGVVELVQRCAGLHVLVTSREALRVRGERRIAVPPLGLPASEGETADLLGAAAVRLFLERAQETHGNVRPSDEDARAIADICRRLDGLPLAIELAAARLSLFSPPELRDRLSGRLDALGEGARDLPARQRTLRSTIEWSYELLDANEQAIFRLFSVFATAQPTAVEAVANGVPELPSVDVLEVLGSLIDKSLIRPTDEPAGRRLDILETIRDYARERLSEDPLAGTIERAHAEHFAAFALTLHDEIRGPERMVTIGRIESELGNLMTAWRYWLREGDLDQLDALLDPLWLLHDARGWYLGAVELTNGLLDVLGRSPTSVERAQEEVTVRTGLARALMAIRGYTPEVEDAYSRALALADETGGLPERIPVLRSLAALYLYRGEFDRSVEVGRQLLRIAEEQRDVGLEVEGHLRIGAGLVSLGQTDRALEHLGRAVALFDPGRHGTGRFRLGPSPGVTPHTTSAFVLWLTGNAAQAHEHAALALGMADRLDQPYTRAYALFHVGLLHAWERRWARVRELAASVLEIAEAHGYRVWQATALVLDGAAMTALGMHDEGIEASDEGLVLYQEMTAPPIFWPLLLSLRASTLRHVGREQEGLEALDDAMALVQGPPNVLAPQFLVLRGDLHASIGDIEQATDAYRRAIEVAHAAGARMSELQATIGLVHVASEGLKQDAIEQLRDVYAGFTEGFDAPDVAAARDLLSP
jgi:predicted ATPase/class 3 adenylate cyclase